MTGNLIWIDLETTGLDPNTGKILEVGAIATTTDLDVIAEDSFLVDPIDVLKSFEHAPANVQKMHTDNGLIEALILGQACGTLTPFGGIATRLSVFADAHGCTGADGNGDPWRSPLCGSNPAFDRNWLRVHAPAFERKLHYRNLDVSTVHALAGYWFGEAFEHKAESVSTHRAIDDIRFSIARLRWYRSHVFSPHSRAVVQGPLT